MTLASKCREVMQQAALYKQQLDQQKATMADWQRSEVKQTVSSPVLVSSDDFEERDFSKESETTPTPLLISPSKDASEQSPLRESPLIHPHRFFSQSASPKLQRKTAYNEEFPGDIITPKVPSRRVNFQRMGSFEELECEDDIELEAPLAKDDSRHRDAPGLEKKEQSERDMSSLDAFEASFRTDFARSFSSSDNVPPSNEIYDPFSNSPVKINLSAATPIIEKPYEAEPRSPSRGAFASDPPGVDKTSTRPNGPLYNESKSKTIPPPPPPRAKAGVKNNKSGSAVSSARSASVITPSELQSGGVATENASKKGNTSSKQSQSTTVPKVTKSVLSEQSVASPQSVSLSITAESASKDKAPVVSPKQSQSAPVSKVTKPALAEQPAESLESTELVAPADVVSKSKASVISPKQSQMASASKVTKPVPSEHSIASLESGGSPVDNVSKRKVGSVPKSTSPVLSEQSKNVANKVSLAEQVLTVQSKAALLLSAPEMPEVDDPSKGSSTNSEPTPKAPRSEDTVEKAKAKPVSSRESPKRDKPVVPAQRPTNSTHGSSNEGERATVGQTKTIFSTEKTLESSNVDMVSMNRPVSNSPTNDNQAEVEEKEVNTPLHLATSAIPVKPNIIAASASALNQKERHPASGATSSPVKTTDALQSDMISSSDVSERYPKRAQNQETTMLTQSAEFSPQPAKSLVTEPASMASALDCVTLVEFPTSEKSVMSERMAANLARTPETSVADQTALPTTAAEKPSNFHNSHAGAYASPSPSALRHARVTPSPALTPSTNVMSTELEREETDTSRPNAAVDNHTAPHSPKKWPPVSVPAVSPSKANDAYSVDLFSSGTSTLKKNGVINAPQSPPWVKTRSYVAEGSGPRSLKSNGGASVFPKTSPSVKAPKVIEEPAFNGNGSSSSLRSRESNYQSSSSPFRNSFGETRPTWATSSTNKDDTEPSDANLSPSAVRRSWQKSASDSRSSWSHDRNTSRVESSSTTSSKLVESRPWQTESSKSSLPQQDRLQGDKSKATTLSSIHRNSYIGNQSLVQTFKPTMKIKELAAAFESRSPEKSYVTSCDASTPSDEECGEIPMVSPPRVEEVRKSLNSQFGHI